MKSLVLLAVIALLVFPRHAAAYLDPGTGSYFLQILLAAVLGASFAVKAFWRNIKSFIAGVFSRRSQAEDERE